MTDIENKDTSSLLSKRKQEQSIDDLMKLAQPLLKDYYSSKTEQQRLESEYNLKALEVTARQNKLIIYGLLAIFGFLIAVATYLFITNRDQTAITLIQIVVSISGAAFGGYGVAMHRRSKEED